MSFLNSLLLTLIKALHTLINNYALTIIVFTILIKLVVMPLNLSTEFRRYLICLPSDRTVL